MNITCHLVSSFPNSIGERNCLRNSVAPLSKIGAKWNFAGNKGRSQIEFGNERQLFCDRLPSPPLGQRRLPKRRSSRLGFTLMEMIIVLSIIALLMGLVIMNLGGVQDVAKIKKAQADLIALREALSTYEVQTGTLPTTDQGLKALWAKPTTDPVPDQWHKIMDEEVLDPWGHSYKYQNPGKHNTDGYDVYSMGPDGQDGTEDDIGNWKAEKSASSQ
jgi:general secretion pathway protein G